MSGVLFELPHKLHCTAIPENITTTVNCSIAPILLLGNLDVDKASSVYLVIVMFIAVAQSTIQALIPALVGDQVQKDNARCLHDMHY